MFHDRAGIHVQAGRGGDGGLSFRREKHVPRGGPDGGDGGGGGDVIVVADAGLRDLSAFRRPVRIKAGRGGSGRNARKHGADGEDVVLRVPVGTQVLDADDALVADLASDGARYVAARGGPGGRGNARFATPTRQTPRFAETGVPGEQTDVVLHLKLLADAALAGLPNAGKSSLLRRISNAKPKVADYPFTTIEPVLGTVDGPAGRQLTVIDVPGLIEGASEGVGLGHDFLAHLERARILVHVIDAAAADTREQFAAIDRELAAYGGGLPERRQIVALNKIDLLAAPPDFLVDDRRVARVVGISCVTGEGIAQLQHALFELCPLESPATSDDVLPEFVEYRPRVERRRSFRILRTDRGYRVVGTPPSVDELEEALRAAGVRRGAEVEVEGETLEWQ